MGRVDRKYSFGLGLLNSSQGTLKNEEANSSTPGNGRKKIALQHAWIGGSGVGQNGGQADEAMSSTFLPPGERGGEKQSHPKHTTTAKITEIDGPPK